MKKSVRGFCNDEVSRKLIQRYKLSGDVIKTENLDVEADVTFDAASIEFDEKTLRPYISFREGHITSITGDFPFDVSRCNFTRKNAPDLEIQWELSNEEIKELIDKGLYGFDSTYPKQKSSFGIPDVFTEVLWVGIPVKATSYAFETELEDGTKIPLVSIEIEQPYNQITDSNKTKYDNIATYFARPEFYDAAYIENKNEYFTLDDEDVLVSFESDEKQEVAYNSKIETLQQLTPSQMKEEAVIDKLRQQLHHNIETASINNSAETKTFKDENKGIEFIEVENENKVIGEYEPYTADELEALHIVAHTDEIYKKAEAKITAQSIKSPSEQPELF